MGNIRKNGVKKFQSIAEVLGLYAVNSVVCPEVGLSTQSNADLALSTITNLKITKSIYPHPTNNFIQNTDDKGFQTFSEYKNLSDYIIEVVNSDMDFFSSMVPKMKLGQIITVSAKENDDISKAEKFLTLISQ